MIQIVQFAIGSSFIVLIAISSWICGMGMGWLLGRLAGRKAANSDGIDDLLTASRRRTQGGAPGSPAATAGAPGVRPGV